MLPCELRIPCARTSNTVPPIRRASNSELPFAGGGVSPRTPLALSKNYENLSATATPPNFYYYYRLQTTHDNRSTDPPFRQGPVSCHVLPTTDYRLQTTHDNRSTDPPFRQGSVSCHVLPTTRARTRRRPQGNWSKFGPRSGHNFRTRPRIDSKLDAIDRSRRGTSK